MNKQLFKWLGLKAPIGVELEKIIQSNWSQWLEIIEKTNLTKTKKYRGMSTSQIGKYIYSNTLWGFSFDDWDKEPFNAVKFFRTSVYQHVQTFEGYPREVYLLYNWILQVLFNETKK